MALVCGFIGLGLIGGSIAKALKEKRSDVQIIAYDEKKESLKLALEEGIVDLAAEKIDDTFSYCDYLFLCAPVQKNAENLPAVRKILSPDCILTDVGSVKSDIHRHVAAEGLNAQFIGGHPMTGSERTGYINSKSLLLENAYYILTPTKDVPEEKIAAFKDLVACMGAIPLLLDCKEHDYATAAVSHLPHVAAACLVNLVEESDTPEGILKQIAAGGFKDITRIASSSASVWQQICLTNTENIVMLLEQYIHSLTQVKDFLCCKRSEKIYDFFEDARKYRDSFNAPAAGAIFASYEMTVDIKDEPGALAAIATLLALRQISIKNMSILHNREIRDGVLKIELCSEEDCEKAKNILTEKGYGVY